MPEEIDTLDRKIRQLEIEREAIRREKDEERINQLTKEIEELKKYVQTKKYVEEVAKERLGLVYKDEILFKAEE